MLLAKKARNPHLVLVMYGQIGYAFHVLSEYEAALYYYKKQLQLSWDEGIKFVETDIYDNIGIEYYYLGDLEKSAYYHNASMNGGVKFGKEERMLSPKAKENMKAEFKREFLANGGIKNVPDEFLERTYEARLTAKWVQKMRYIKERGFSEELTRTSIEKIKKELKRDLLPSPRRLETRVPFEGVSFSVATKVGTAGGSGMLPKITPTKQLSLSRDHSYVFFGWA